MSANEKAKVSAAAQVIVAVAECIRDLGSVPSGHLYAHLMTSGMNIHSYETVIDVLVASGMVRRDASHLLTWIGKEAK